MILNPFKPLVVLCNLHCLKIICGDIASRSQIYGWFKSMYSKSQLLFPLIYQRCQVESVCYSYYSNIFSIIVFATKSLRKYFWRQVILSLYLVKSTTQLGAVGSYQRIYACPHLSLRAHRLVVAAWYEQHLLRRLLFHSYSEKKKEKEKMALKKHFVHSFSDGANYLSFQNDLPFYRLIKP